MGDFFEDWEKYVKASKLVLDKETRVGINNSAAIISTDNIQQNLDNNRIQVQISASGGSDPIVPTEITRGYILDKINKGEYRDLLEGGGDRATPLHLACASGDTGIALAIIEKAPGLIEITNQDNATALIVAAAEGLGPVVGAIIESKHFNGIKNVQAKESGNTALHRALMRKDKDGDLIAGALIQNEANVNIVNREGKTPLSLALENEHTDINKTIIKELLLKGAQPEEDQKKKISELNENPEPVVFVPSIRTNPKDADFDELYDIMRAWHYRNDPNVDHVASYSEQIRSDPDREEIRQGIISRSVEANGRSFQNIESRNAKFKYNKIESHNHGDYTKMEFLGADTSLTYSYKTYNIGKDSNGKDVFLHMAVGKDDNKLYLAKESIDKISEARLDVCIKIGDECIDFHKGEYFIIDKEKGSRVGGRSEIAGLKLGMSSGGVAQDIKAQKSLKEILGNSQGKGQGQGMQNSTETKHRETGELNVENGQIPEFDVELTPEEMRKYLTRQDRNKVISKKLTSAQESIAEYIKKYSDIITENNSKIDLEKRELAENLKKKQEELKEENEKTDINKMTFFKVIRHKLSGTNAEDKKNQIGKEIAELTSAMGELEGGKNSTSDTAYKELMQQSEDFAKRQTRINKEQHLLDVYKYIETQGVVNFVYDPEKYTDVKDAKHIYGRNQTYIKYFNPNPDMCVLWNDDLRGDSAKNKIVIKHTDNEVQFGYVNNENKFIFDGQSQPFIADRNKDLIKSIISVHSEDYKLCLLRLLTEGAKKDSSTEEQGNHAISQLAQIHRNVSSNKGNFTPFPTPVVENLNREDHSL